MAADGSITIDLPLPSLVALVGVSGSGKSRFAARHFAPTQVVSSDRLRAAISDDESDQSVSAQAFELLHLIVRRRLEARRLAIVDATSVTPEMRRPLVAIARECGVPAVAIVLDVPSTDCIRHDAARDGRRVGDEVIVVQARTLAASIVGIQDEGFAAVHILRGTREIDRVRVVVAGGAEAPPDR